MFSVVDGDYGDYIDRLCELTDYEQAMFGDTSRCNSMIMPARSRSLIHCSASTSKSSAAHKSATAANSVRVNNTCARSASHHNSVRGALLS